MNPLISFCMISFVLRTIAEASTTGYYDRKTSVQNNSQELPDSSDVEHNAGASDVCHTNPCMNGGICKIIGSSSECFCPMGYTGSRCEKEIVRVCSPNPCLNGGSCVQRKGPFPNYICHCTKGYAGLTCEQEFDVCHPNPCLNNGICGKGNGSEPTCYCPSGYSGFTCENGENHRCDFEEGFCDGFVNDTFNRMANWTVQQGRNVGVPTKDHTYNNPEGHFAYLHLPEKVAVIAVLNTPWLYSDHCVKFWYNANLSPKEKPQYAQVTLFTIMVEVPVQGRYPRKSFKSEVNVWQFYNFTEKWSERHKAFRVVFSVVRWPIPFPGYAAIDDVEIIKGNCSSTSETDMCKPNPCRNGGFCEKREGFRYSCFCPAGFTGLNCEKVANPCRSLPCYYGSTCQKVDGVNYICVCPTNATGRWCEKEIGGTEGRAAEDLTDTSAISRSGTPVHTKPAQKTSGARRDQAISCAPKKVARSTTKRVLDIASGVSHFRMDQN